MQPDRHSFRQLHWGRTLCHMGLNQRSNEEQRRASQLCKRWNHENVEPVKEDVCSLHPKPRCQSSFGSQIETGSPLLVLCCHQSMWRRQKSRRPRHIPKKERRTGEKTKKTKDLPTKQTRARPPPHPMKTNTKEQTRRGTTRTTQKSRIPTRRLAPSLRGPTDGSE